MCFGKVPVAVQHFGPRTIEANHVVPSRRDRQAVGRFPIAAAELDLDRPVSVFLGGDLVEQIDLVPAPESKELARGPIFYWLEVA